MLYVVSYDMPDTPRRTKVAKVLMDYGTRVQYSVFECRLDERSLLDKMCRRLDRLIQVKEDNLRIYAVCASCQEVILLKGTARMLEDPDVYIV